MTQACEGDGSNGSGRAWSRTRTWLAFAFVMGLSLSAAHAGGVNKTITVAPGERVVAVATWYFASCSRSLGVGSYSVKVAPEHGSLDFTTENVPLPGCANGPALPAAIAHYTWDSTASADRDTFQLGYVLNGVQVETDNVTVIKTPTCTAEDGVAWQTQATVPGTGDTQSPRVPRSRIGVAELVNLTSSVGPVTWSVASGAGCLTGATTTPSVDDSCPPVTGPAATLTAPYAAGTTVVTAKPADGAACALAFEVVQPEGLVFQRLRSPPLNAPGYGLENGSLAMYSIVFVTPADVSFKNIAFSEHDVFPPEQPHSEQISEPPVVVPIAGQDAEFLSCDSDKEPILGTDVTFPFVFQDLHGGHVTPFSSVRTTTPVFIPYELKKGQVQGLVSGALVDTPDPTNAKTAVLDLPPDAPGATLQSLGATAADGLAMCRKLVECQYGLDSCPTADGVTCASDAACSSGHCVDQTCCARASCGEGQTCGTPSGTCEPVEPDAAGCSASGGPMATGLLTAFIPLAVVRRRKRSHAGSASHRS